MKWNTNNPLNPDNYICDLGAYGVALCWWDEKKWIKMWTAEEVNVWGWIKIPTYEPLKQIT